MIRAGYIRHTLEFLSPAGTSRGILHRKPCWFVWLRNSDGTTGAGEVTFIPGLSPGDENHIEGELLDTIRKVNQGQTGPCRSDHPHPGIRFAFETACRDLQTGGRRLLYDTAFTRGEQGIPVNGLIWMGDREHLLDQIGRKVDEGFRVLKMKVGALDFEAELGILKHIREHFGKRDLEIRLDANGAWGPEEALKKLHRLSEFRIHSIEQPIRAGQLPAMAAVCRTSPIPVALDEELIGVDAGTRGRALLEDVKPAYLILKPGLIGGWKAASDWIGLARQAGAGWWVTSALESNVGLNALAQWTSHLDTGRPQGLGTGGLFANNIPSPLGLEGNALWHRPWRPWNLELFDRAWKE